MDEVRAGTTSSGIFAFTSEGLDIREIQTVAKGRVQVLRARGHSTPAADSRKLPHTPNSACGVDPIALWRAPDDWLVYSTSLEIGAIADWVSTITSEAPLVTTDVSAASIVFELSGAMVIDVLMRDCTLDLEGDAVRPGACAQTVFAQTSVLLHRPTEDRAWRLFVERSVAQHVWEWLLDSAVGHAVGSP
jgi:heterotetrameric sarcosine oxidase gamma subunit